MEKVTIKVQPNQQKLFDLLLKFREQQKINTIIRVAGGWVRDKMLGKESHDIDFALDDMDGESFTLMLKKYCQQNKVEGKVSGMGVTKFNPEQSKNLKTATVRINDYMIDIVNLRSQKYTQDSRIPSIEIGTPKQDALRRDLTINALFYNIVTNEIEDYTGQGLEDLKNGIIRTPLDPFITFKDDPLRILRVFRFAGRFGYKILPNILQAAARNDIKQILRVKVSKQRVGIQLFSMLEAQKPEDSLQYILQTGLWNIVFQIPQTSDLTDQNIINQIPQRSLSVFKDLKQNLLVYPELYEKDQLPKIYLSSLTYVYQPYIVKLPKGNPQPLIQYMVKSSLKKSNSDADFPLRVNQGAVNLLKLISNPQLLNQINLIKWLLAVGNKWRFALLISLTVEPKNKQQILKFKTLIESKNWSQLYNIQPAVDGTDLNKLLDKKGKIVGVILNNLKIWTVLNQPPKTKEEVLEVLKQQIDKFSDPNMYE